MGDVHVVHEFKYPASLVVSRCQHSYVAPHLVVTIPFEDEVCTVTFGGVVAFTVADTYVGNSLIANWNSGHDLCYDAVQVLSPSKAISLDIVLSRFIGIVDGSKCYYVTLDSELCACVVASDCQVEYAS